MRTLRPWSLEALVKREEIFDGLITKAVKMALRPLALNVDGLLTAAAAELSVSDLASSMLGPTVSMDSAGALTVSWDKFVGSELVPFLADTFLEGAAQAREGLPDDVTHVADFIAQDYLATAANNLRNIGEIVWMSIRSQLQEGVEAGEDMRQLATRVRAASQVTAGRAMTIARTEVHRAAEAGSLAQMRLAGFTNFECRKRWLATEDERTRLWHVQVDGQTVGLNEVFDVGGEGLQFPGDPNGRADNVINCRCTMTYLFPDDEDDEDTLTSAAHEFHLKGQHNQKDHGRRGARAAVKAPVDSSAATFTFGEPKEIWRGVTSKEGAEHSREGGLGTGDFGRGIYTSTTIATAQQYSKAFMGDKKGVIMRGFIQPNAVVAEVPEGISGSAKIDAWAQQHGIQVVQVDNYLIVKDPSAVGFTSSDYTLAESVVLDYRKKGYDIPEGYADAAVSLDEKLKNDKEALVSSGAPSQITYALWTKEDELAHPRDNVGRFRRKDEHGPVLKDLGEKISVAAEPEISLRDLLPLVTEDTVTPPKIPKDLVKQLHETFEGTFSGFQTKVSSIEWANGDARLRVGGEIYDSNGDEVGEFKRVFKVTRDGTFMVDHEFLLMSSAVQGQGFSKEFNKHAFANYKKMGLQRVQLQADIDVGGYAWAREGYDWAPDDVDSLAGVLERIDRARAPQLAEPAPRTQRQIDDVFFPISHNLYKIPEERREEQATLIRNLWLDIGGTVDMDTPEDELMDIIEMWPTPYELSQLGRWPGAGKDDWWVGKAIMYGSNWMGVKYLDDNSLVNA